MLADLAVVMVVVIKLETRKEKREIAERERR